MKLNLLRQIMIISKYTLFGIFLQVICYSFLIAAETNAQQNKSVKEVAIDLKMKSASIAEVFGYIESNTAFLFSYDRKDIDGNKMINFNSQYSTVADILIEISKQANLKFKQVNQNINVNQVRDKRELKEGNVIEVIIQARNITGRITSQEDSEGLPGVNVIEKGTSNGTVSDVLGNYSLTVSEGAILVFSSVGFTSEEILIGNRQVIDLVMLPDIKQLQELVVVGYGVQKRSDITGTVASLPKDRLEMTPNLNIAQVIQGAIPGVMIQTSSAGAAPSEVLMIRGRNSIRASNDPLIVVDGIPYGGQLSDINPHDVQSIEVLKDASAAAIYGSRGANGVILITSKEGVTGKAKIMYDGKYSVQKVSNLPGLMTGEEFYNFKKQREPNNITATEQAVYDAGEWVDWADMALRTGQSQQHNLSVSGGLTNVNYYIAGGLLDVQGVQVNDNYRRLTSRINVDITINDWLKIGTRTNLSFDDKSGQSPTSGVWRMNPLTRPYDEDGNLTIYPWPEDIYFENPLESTLFDDKDKSYQLSTNNFAIVDFPFAKGLKFRINTGIRRRTHDMADYAGRNTGTGFEVRGLAHTTRELGNGTTVENLLSYNREFGKHNIFATALYSFEESESSSNGLTARGFPHDFLSWYAAPQAEVVNPSYSYDKTNLISQMVRLNYAYNSRYLMTLTGRRDGYSGFGADNKWGIFPSVAIGWNLAEEEFFPFKGLFNELKIRTSYGVNGNQAVGAYETISKLGSYNIVSNKATVPGYVPITLGQDNLGWESSKSLNVGLDFGILQHRISGDLNLYKTTTTALLLNRSISSVHGISWITQNIGETENKGIEFSVVSRNIDAGDFKWMTTGNMAFVKNKILSLYGYLDENGKEIDDIGNKWFIGQPIRVNYNYVIAGVWQLDEADEAALWNSQPGFVKFKDVNGDKLLSATEDREIIGQQDPKFLWGMSNTFSYKNFKLDIFMHGVHGVTRANVLMIDDVYETVRRNTIRKNWWTPENPTNDFYMNHKFANTLGGDENVDFYFENASFVRLKQLTFSYDLPETLLGKANLDKIRLYVTGTNLFTFTNWRGMDPELDDQRNTPYQKEFVVGLTLGF